MIRRSCPQNFSGGKWYRNSKTIHINHVTLEVLPKLPFKIIMLQVGLLFLLVSIIIGSFVCLKNPCMFKPATNSPDVAVLLMWHFCNGFPLQSVVQNPRPTTAKSEKQKSPLLSFATYLKKSFSWEGEHPKFSWKEKATKINSLKFILRYTCALMFFINDSDYRCLKEPLSQTPTNSVNSWAIVGFHGAPSKELSKHRTLPFPKKVKGKWCWKAETTKKHIQFKGYV